MKVASGASTAWAGADTWFAPRKAPLVFVLSGIDSSPIVEASLTDKALLEAAMPRFEPNCTPPCDALLWRLETASGEAFNQPGLLRRHWHRSPYAITLRLVQYQVGSMLPEILDEGTLSTCKSYVAFKTATDRLAMRFLRDVALGRSRGASDTVPAAPVHGLPGWLDAMCFNWRKRPMADWSSTRTSAMLSEDVLAGRGLGSAGWVCQNAESRHVATRTSGDDRIQCPELPGAVGPIVNAMQERGPLVDGGIAYYEPHSPDCGTTHINRLGKHFRLVPVCDVAPHSRLADPTLFRWSGRFWLACTDLDAGIDDNLCFLHAPAITGPWTPHARWPVKIDVRSARPAGMLISRSGRLFRPGQDCSSAAGSAIAIHEVSSLTEIDFQETLITTLRQNRDQTPHRGRGSVRG